MEFIFNDDHADLRRAIQEVLPEAVWKRCYMHFLRNALAIWRGKQTTIACENCAKVTIGETRKKHAKARRPACGPPLRHASVRVCRMP